MLVFFSPFPLHNLRLRWECYIIISTSRTKQNGDRGRWRWGAGWQPKGISKWTCEILNIKNGKNDHGKLLGIAETLPTSLNRYINVYPTAAKKMCLHVLKCLVNDRRKIPCGLSICLFFIQGGHQVELI